MFFVSSSFKLAYVSAHKIRSFAFAASFLLFISFARQYIESNRGFPVSCVKYTFSNLFFFSFKVLDLLFNLMVNYILQRQHPSETRAMRVLLNILRVLFLFLFRRVFVACGVCVNSVYRTLVQRFPSIVKLSFCF